MESAAGRGHGSGGSVILEAADLDRLIGALRAREYRVVGPVLRDGAIVYDDLESAADLPRGWTDEQEAGHYRIKRRDDDAYFGYNVGPQSWKQFLFPPRHRLWTAEASADGLTLREEPPEPQKLAFLGIRACELRALFIQDKVFLGSGFVDPVYQPRREDVFLIAVHCGQAGATCFCVSMEAGPRAESGFDLALAELRDDGAPYFVAESGSDRGAELLDTLAAPPAQPRHRDAVDALVENTARQMGRTLDTTGIQALLQDNLNHPQWEDVANRCLTCANCTLVCPTCFCSTVEDVTDLTGEHAERWRRWDSCFTLDFTYMNHGYTRQTTTGRYRQWMTHKLSTWHDQFGTSGCVGCGRCITWCPVGIDITEETRAIRDNPADATGHLIPKQGG